MILDATPTPYRSITLSTPDDFSRFTATPAPIRATPPPFNAPEYTLPANGAIVRYSKSKAQIPLEITTPYLGGHHFIKLIDKASNTTVLTVFVREGQIFHPSHRSQRHPVL